MKCLLHNEIQTARCNNKMLHWQFVKSNYLYASLSNKLYSKFMYVNASQYLKVTSKFATVLCFKQIITLNKILLLHHVTDSNIYIKVSYLETTPVEEQQEGVAGTLVDLTGVPS